MRDAGPNCHWFYPVRVRAAWRGARRRAEALTMSLELVLGGALGVALLILFLAALLRPERF